MQENPLEYVDGTYLATGYANREESCAFPSVVVFRSNHESTT